MKILRRFTFSIVACVLLLAVASAQEAPKPDNNSSVTIITSGDISITHPSEGKTAVYVNFAPGKAKSSDSRITISGPYTLDVNGGVNEVKTSQGLELHVLSHEELRFEAPEIVAWEQTHRYSESTACSKIPKFPGCGNPVCDQFGHPGDQCRYNSLSGCACIAPGGGPCSETATPAPEKK